MALPEQPIGWAILRRDAPSIRPRTFYQCYFYVMDGDRCTLFDPGYELGCPGEAVDPLTVEPGVDGIQNDRAWGGPIPSGPRRREALP